jgi:hypothetical protein
MVVELIFCSLFVPPYVDVYFTGSNTMATYTVSLNDIGK